MFFKMGSQLLQIRDKPPSSYAQFSSTYTRHSDSCECYTYLISVPRFMRNARIKWHKARYKYNCLHCTYAKLNLCYSMPFILLQYAFQSAGLCFIITSRSKP